MWTSSASQFKMVILANLLDLYPKKDGKTWALKGVAEFADVSSLSFLLPYTFFF